MNGERLVGGVMTDTAFNGRNKKKLFTIKVHKQCPLVLLVKVGRREGKAFGSGARRDVKQGLSRLDRTDFKSKSLRK
jgi:hypothetical protein